MEYDENRERKFMFYSNGYIGHKSYFPDIRSNVYIQVCTNFLITVMIGSAPVEVDLVRGMSDEYLCKVADRKYLVTLSNDLSLMKQETLFWFFALCITRYELHGCIFEHELFGGSTSSDINQLSESFCNIANIIVDPGLNVNADDIQAVLFMISPGKECRIDFKAVFQ